MFTVKAIIENATIIKEQSKIIIGRPGSSQYDDAMTLVKGAEYTVDIILDKPSTYFDKACEHVDEEGYTIKVARLNDVDSMPIAVLIDVDRDDPETRATAAEAHYQLIYPGDEVYVTDSNGKTVETVR